MARMSAGEAAAKWARRASAASQDYASGVARVTQAPGQAAAAKSGKALAGYQDAITSGRWAANVSRVSLADWQNAATNIGAPRYSQGVAAAQGKMETAMARVLPMIDSAKSAVASMPDDTVEARINKAAAFQRKMHELGRTKR